MRLLHLVKTSTGATWALRQMRELVRLGVDVHVALPPDGSLITKYQSAGVIVHSMQTDFPLTNPLLLPKRIDGLRSLVNQIKPDLVHSHFVGTTLTMRLALSSYQNLPRIFQVPGPLHLESDFYKTMEIASANTLDYWIGSCKWTCDKYRLSGIPDARIFLSYYGTDIDAFVRSTPETLRSELGFNGRESIIGMIAYMYAPKRILGQKRGIKGHEDLLDALSICLQKTPNIYGIFVGGAWNNAVTYEKQIHAYAKNRCGNNAIFLGTRSDIAKIYSGIDVAVHPSHSENVGGAVESLLLGVPTIATNVGGFPDIIINGETGRLVPPKAPAQLAEAVGETLDNPQKSHEMASNGKDLARNLFDIKRTALEIFNIYTLILDSRKSA